MRAPGRGPPPRGATSTCSKTRSRSNLLVERGIAPPTALAGARCWGRVRARPRERHGGQIHRAPARRCSPTGGGPARSICTRRNPRQSPRATALRWAIGRARRSPTWNSSNSIRPAFTIRPPSRSSHLRGAGGGEGAILRLPERHAVHEGATIPDGELAPARRSRPARIDSEMKRHGAGLRAARHQPSGRLISCAAAFPNIFNRCLSFGFDLTRAPDSGGTGGALHCAEGW